MSYSSNNYDYSSGEEEYYYDDRETAPQEPSYYATIRSALSEVTELDIFCTGGRLQEAPVSNIRIEGLFPSMLYLPLQTEQATALASICQPAPFGRGEETIVDDKIRLCKQLDASKISVGEAWDRCIQRLAEKCAQEMGVTAAVKANMYKMLMYEDGGFFKPHKDTEKEDGMFGTLMVQLPCKHEAGTLVVKHRGDVKKFKFWEQSEDWFYYAAFYADCEHELTKVTGRRLMLAYNLVKVSDGVVPKIVDIEQDLKDMVKQGGTQWIESAGEPERFVIKLKHQYTESSLSFQNLKGGDWAMVSLLRSSGTFMMQLALVELYRHFYYGSGGEITNRARTVTLVSENDMSSRLHIDKREKDLLTKERVFNVNRRPDKESFFGNMGNEGAQRDKWYYEAVLVVWPKARGALWKWRGDCEEALKEIQEKALQNTEEAEELLYDVLHGIVNLYTVMLRTKIKLVLMAIELKSKRCVVDGLSMLPGCRNQVVDAILVLYNQFAWDDIKESLLGVIKSTSFENIDFCLMLVKALQQDKDKMDAFEAVVRETLLVAIRKGISADAGKTCRIVCSFPNFEDLRERFVNAISWSHQGYGGSTIAIASAIQGMNEECFVREKREGSTDL